MDNNFTNSILENGRKNRESIKRQITNIYDNGFGVKVSNGEIVFTEVQLEGKNKMSAKEFLNGVNKEEFIGRVLD